MLNFSILFSLYFQALILVMDPPIDPCKFCCTLFDPYDAALLEKSFILVLLLFLAKLRDTWPVLSTQTPYFNYTAVLPVFQLQKWICAEKINICEYVLYYYLLFLKKSCASAIQCLYWPASPIMIINCLISKDQNQAGFMSLYCPVYFLLHSSTGMWNQIQ